MEDKGNNNNATCVCNDKAFEEALLSDANSSWQKERWGNTVTDHREDPTGNGKAGEKEKGERRWGKQHGREDCNDDDVNIASVAVVTAALNVTINQQ